MSQGLCTCCRGSYDGSERVHTSSCLTRFAEGSRVRFGAGGFGGSRLAAGY